MTNFDIESILFFGDSYTDGGRFTQLLSGATGTGTNPLVNPDIFTEGQANNGFNYANFLPGELGVEDTQNFAVSGARALVDRTIFDFLDTFGIPKDPDAPEGLERMDLSGQVDSFLAGIPEDGLSDNATASIFIGINDVNAPDFPVTGDSVEADAITFGDRLFEEVLNQAGRLEDAGVENLILYTIPKQGDLPLNSEFGFLSEDILAASDIASAHFNDRVRAETDAFADLGLNIKLVDFAELFDEVQGEILTFGFRTFDDPQTLDSQTINPAVEGVPIDQIAMTDVIHPSEKLNEVMLQFELGVLTGNSQIGTSGSDYLTGTRDQDMILGRDGSDFISLGRGDDVALGGLGADIVKGGRSDDLISGGGGSDLLTGGRGDDVIADGSGNDRSIGARGEDVLIDGLGSDVLVGGRGDDVFIFTEQSLYGADDSDDSNLFIGGRGNDHLVLRLEADTAAAYEAGELTLADLGITATRIESIEVVVGLDLPDGLESNPLVADAQDWGFV
ncbi:animal heme peroxidase [Rhodobacteraceae bacterium KLH11]|nr:animal heme peroxidase [Rhodobacteraceae bacterium KLH11]